MNEPTDLISVDDAAQLLGIEPRRIKQLVRDRILFTVPGEDGKPAIPREIIVKSEGKWEPASAPRKLWPGCIRPKLSWVRLRCRPSSKGVSTG